MFRTKSLEVPLEGATTVASSGGRCEPDEIILTLPILTAALRTHLLSSNFIAFKRDIARKAMTKEKKREIQTAFEQRLQKGVRAILGAHGITEDIFPIVSRINYLGEDVFDHTCAFLRLQEIALGNYDALAQWFLDNRSQLRSEAQVSKSDEELLREERSVHREKRAELLGRHAEKKSALESATTALASALPETLTLDVLLKSISTAKKGSGEEGAFDVRTVITTLLPSATESDEDDWEAEADALSSASNVDVIVRLYTVFAHSKLEYKSVLAVIDTFNGATRKKVEKKRRAELLKPMDEETLAFHACNFELHTLGLGASVALAQKHLASSHSEHRRATASFFSDGFDLIDLSTL
jgi:hypothetical protein